METDRQSKRLTDRQSQRQTDTDTPTEIINREQREHISLRKKLEKSWIFFQPFPIKFKLKNICKMHMQRKLYLGNQRK